MVNCLRTVAAEEGVASLWKGLTPFLGQLTLKYALRMGSNAFFLELLRDKVRCGPAALRCAVRCCALPGPEGGGGGPMPSSWSCCPTRCAAAHCWGAPA